MKAAGAGRGGCGGPAGAAPVDDGEAVGGVAGRAGLGGARLRPRRAVDRDRGRAEHDHEAGDADRGDPAIAPSSARRCRDEADGGDDGPAASRAAQARYRAGSRRAWDPPRRGSKTGTGTKAPRQGRTYCCICTSSRITAKSWRSSCRSASSPELRVDELCPSGSRIASSASRFSGRSSTSRMFAISPSASVDTQSPYRKAADLLERQHRAAAVAASAASGIVRRAAPRGSCDDRDAAALLDRARGRRRRPRSRR